MGGGDLADRVAGEDVGLEAALAQRLIESDLDREEGGLGAGGVLEQLCRLLALGEDDLFERSLQVGIELLAGPIEGISKASRKLGSDS